jgi:hypothetical protein
LPLRALPRHLQLPGSLELADRSNTHCRPPQSEKATESYSRLFVNPFDSEKVENALAPLGAKDRKTFVRLLDQMVETIIRAPRRPMRSTTRRGPAKAA